jgi:hypothetical protein
MPSWFAKRSHERQRVAQETRNAEAAEYLTRAEEASRVIAEHTALRGAELRCLDELLDKLDAAVAVGEFARARQIVEEIVVAYMVVKSGTRDEILKTLGLAEIVSKLKDAK